MKKLILLATVVCVAVLASCEAESGPEQFIGVWHTTQELVDVKIDGPVLPIVEAEREKVYTLTVTDENNYKLSFRADGTGTGSGVGGPFSDWQFRFNFRWQASDDKLTMTSIQDGLGGYLLITDDYTTYFGDEIIWSIEERTDIKMVLSAKYLIWVDGEDDSWTEESVIRYTFERVK
jgi:hypothetical protein